MIRTKDEGRRTRDDKAFTLIELIIVITILGILAAIAIPRYFGITNQANESACKGILGNIRSAISIWHAAYILNDANVTPYSMPEGYPTIAAIRELPLDSDRGSKVMEDGNIPDNPYVTGIFSDHIRDAGLEARGTVSGPEGWAYKPSTGEFWSNTTAGGSNRF